MSKMYLMKSLLVICLIMFAGHAYAQHRYYCEVKGIQKVSSSGLKIIFDFGTNSSYTIWGNLSGKLVFVDENGEEIKFNSMVDASNYMVGRGWVFQQAYSSIYSGAPIIHWIFYKDAVSMEKAREGILTKDEYRKQKKSLREGDK